MVCKDEPVCIFSYSSQKNHDIARLAVDVVGVVVVMVLALLGFAVWLAALVVALIVILAVVGAVAEGLGLWVWVSVGVAGFLFWSYSWFFVVFASGAWLMSAE